MYQVVDFFERKRGFTIPNLILFQLDDSSQRIVVGGYSSHGWIRESKQGVMKQLGKGLMDLNIMGTGGDDSTFLFNLTHNLRFDTLKKKDNNDTVYT